MNLLLRWALNAIALWLTVSLNVGLRLPEADLGALLVSALVLGLVNAVLRPLMILLTLPLTLVTFGGFLLIVNALSLGVVAALTPLDVTGFGGAVLSALILTVFSAVLSRLLRDDDRRYVRA